MKKYLNNWEEKFDEKFVAKNTDIYNNKVEWMSGFNDVDEVEPEEFRKFIRQTILIERQQAIKEERERIREKICEFGIEKTVGEILHCNEK